MAGKSGSSVKLSKADQQAFDDILKAYEDFSRRHLEFLCSIAPEFQEIFKKHSLETWWIEIIPACAPFMIAFNPLGKASEMPLYSAVAAELEQRARVVYSRMQTSDQPASPTKP